MLSLLAPLAPVIDAARSIQRHSLFTHAAASAFFIFLSLPPAMLALVVLIGMIPIEEWTEHSTRSFFAGVHDFIGRFAEEDAANAISIILERRLAPLLAGFQDLTTVGLVDQIQDFLDEALPEEMAQAIGQVTSNILGNRTPGLLTASFVVMLWSASGAVRAVMRAFGTIYEVHGRSWFERNALSLGLTIAFLLTWTLCIAILPVGNAVIVGVVNYFGLDAGVMIAWRATSWCFGGVLLFLMVLSLNRLGPEVSLRWRALLPGSVLTMLLWYLLSEGLVFWMQHSWAKHNATYGALAGVIVLMLWCYLLSLGLLFGAELNTAVLRWRGRPWNAGSQADLEAATRRAVEGQVVVDPLASVVSAIESRVMPGSHLEQTAAAEGPDQDGGTP
jgi:membrane protein